MRQELENSLVGRALDGLCVGIVTTNATGRIEWMNRAAQSTFGLDAEEAGGRNFAKLVRDPQLAEFWQRALESEATTMGEVTLQWPKRRTLKVNATTALDPGGELIGRAIIFCDVTAERTVQVQLSEDATRRLLDLTENWNESAEAREALTAQERRILRLVGSGLSNQQIAKRIHVAPSTVRSHLKNLYGKLGLSNRSEAISYAIRHGMTE